VSSDSLLFILPRLKAAKNKNEWKKDDRNGLLPISPTSQEHARRYADFLSGDYFGSKPYQYEKRYNE
jgi:hypothetical protein